jgi:hypothetical protein
MLFSQFQMYIPPFCMNMESPLIVPEMSTDLRYMNVQRVPTIQG